MDRVMPRFSNRVRQRFPTLNFSSDEDDEEIIIPPGFFNDVEGDDQPEDDEGDEEEEESNAEGSSRGNGSISVILTDPNVLDCAICFEPLTIPVFQCGNGHTACSKCSTKLRNKCPMCRLPIGSSRCCAIEKVIESVKIPCRNMNYGCKKTVSYSMRHLHEWTNHEQTCVHEPCFCPHPSCDFVSSSKRLYTHFSCKHSEFAMPFCYESDFYVSITTTMKYVILQEKVDGTLFILNYGVLSIGNVANITCIAPSSLQKGFSYKLKAIEGDNSLKLKSITESMPSWSEHLPRKVFLLVPNDFLDSSGEQLFQICVRRNGTVPPTGPAQH